jgi:hypothetical protein
VRGQPQQQVPVGNAGEVGPHLRFRGVLFSDERVADHGQRQRCSTTVPGAQELAEKTPGVADPLGMQGISRSRALYEHRRHGVRLRKVTAGLLSNEHLGEAVLRDPHRPLRPCVTHGV